MIRTTNSSERNNGHRKLILKMYVSDIFGDAIGNLLFKARTELVNKVTQRY